MFRWTWRGVRAVGIFCAMIGMAEAGEPFRDCDGCPDLTVLPAGKFMMGSPEDEAGRAEEEGPRHRITIRQGFALGVREVTIGQWRACVAAGGCAALSRPSPADDHPMTGVNWDDAMNYAAWLSLKTGHDYRLPSEAEWEYAARAGGDTAWFWGAAAAPSCGFANLADGGACDDGHAGAAPVGSYAANPIGLYDMAGNVAEWVEDCWFEGYEAAPVDGNARTRSLRTSLPEPYAPYAVGDCGLKPVRGGAWTSPPEAARSAARVGLAKGERRDGIGFRVARTLE